MQTWANCDYFVNMKCLVMTERKVLVTLNGEIVSGSPRISLPPPKLSLREVLKSGHVSGGIRYTIVKVVRFETSLVLHV